MKKTIFTLIFLITALLAICQEMKIEVEGVTTFDNSNFTITEAGNDFPSSITSESSVYLSVVFADYWDKKINSKNWKIDIYKSDLNWNTDLNLEVKRTGDGQNAGNKGKVKIEGGESYNSISNTSYSFFSGMKEVNYIPISFRLSGFSITMGAGNYETNVVLTIYDD
jgi:hypothetical protein